MKALGEVRADVVGYLRRQLVGPYDGAEEVLTDPPNTRYLMGILFPRQYVAEHFFEIAGEELDPDQTEAAPTGEAARAENRFSDESVRSANDYLPSSVGISFFTDADRIRVTAAAGRYDTLNGEAAKTALGGAGNPDGSTEGAARSGVSRTARQRRVWQREQLVASEIDFEQSDRHLLWDGRAELVVRWRRLAKGNLITVSLLNATTGQPEQTGSLWDDMLFQTSVRVDVPDGRLREYPTPALASTDPEESELRMLYRQHRIYAVGHGCAADWGDAETVTWACSEVMPSASVPRIAASGDAEEILELRNLAPTGLEDERLLTGLDRFVGGYRRWIDDLRTAAERELEPEMRDAADRVLERLDQAHARMSAGVQALRESEYGLIAFRIANDAMLRQMVHSRPELAGTRRRRRDPVDVNPTYDTDNTWRAFQLGFVLTALAGLVYPDREDRDVVDLIWFPTGGGKTEAYLLLACFEIAHRRLAHGPAGAGTTVFSRYTLSLLTAQQFQRTATSICALEAIRRERSDLGEDPVSIGLWVGAPTTPNHYDSAKEKFELLREAPQPQDEFLLERCPWCGTEILPRAHSDDDAEYGITSTPSAFRFHCTREECLFHDRLWIHVVDDDLYERPPTFLLGTVDKFAALAWEPRSGVFFGGGGHRRPSLIIQDELHLLTGPLGTIAGVYEAAIDLLCEQDGRGPKVVSSTATIRRAGPQVNGLFGRRVSLFPPSGITADDSYFAAVDQEAPPRLYVGLMAQGHTSDTATVQTCTALLQAPIDLELDGSAKDAYWTLVAYHNSLRELGRTVTMAHDDIPARMKTLMAGRPQRGDYTVEELTSNVPRSDQPRLLERMSYGFENPDHIGMVASTNMLSVGVDVARLGLMLMNGQPKANAEYIQATSRVGRATTPGLIVTLFRPTRPRDRSHYENFRPFHASLYRHVEPTTVTPFAPPSRDRSLHAALVVLVRHRLGLTLDSDAGGILERRSEVQDMADLLLDVVHRVEPREIDGSRRDLERFVDQWIDLAEEAASAGKSLYYKPNGKGHLNLLKDYNTKGTGKPTLRSMRNVDRETLVTVAGLPAAKGTK